MERIFVALGAFAAALGVAAGAFGAHALRGRLTPDMAAVFETAVRYQLVHALALLFIGWALTRWPGRMALAAGWLFAAGIVLFSGSLMALALTGERGLAVLAPIGGTAFIVGWAALALAALRSGRNG